MIKPSISYFLFVFAFHTLYKAVFIECFRLEGTFRGHLAQPPCSEQGYLQPDQVAQSNVQPDLEYF